MNSTEIFNYIFESFDKQKVQYVILHSYQEMPYKFDSDIDTALVVDKIEDAIALLNSTLDGTDWKLIQYWRHENYAADCVISNNHEFLQVDFCTHYERNGRLVMSVDELVSERKKYINFYVPNGVTEFTYIFLKKVLKKKFSDGSKEHLLGLLENMNDSEHDDLKRSLERFFDKKEIEEVLIKIKEKNFTEINLKTLNDELLRNTSSIGSDLHYKIFDTKRKIERIAHPTGLFVVLLGVDGAGKTTITTQLKESYLTAFRRIDHYHSRVRILKDISQLKKDTAPIDASNPHSKTKQAGKLISIVKFGYYFWDFLMGNVVITTAKIKSSLVLVERYYYDYSIDKVRYNLNLSNSFLSLFGKFILKPDLVFILTGDSQKLLERKYEITLEEINFQKEKLYEMFKDDPRAIFIDTTEATVDECIDKMIEKCNTIMRGRRKW